MSEDPRLSRMGAARNQRLILDAASAVFAERGPEATLAEVAARAGVGVGTINRRYPNRDVLIDELFAERLRSVLAAAGEALDAPEAWEGLVSFLEWTTEKQSADPGLRALVQGSPRGRERMAAALEQVGAPIASLVRRAQAEERLRPDVAPADIGLVGIMLGAVVEATRESGPELWRRALAILLDGLRAAPAGGAPAALQPLEAGATEIASLLRE